MKALHQQRLERTTLSKDIDNYSKEKLRTIFRRLSPLARSKWLEHFAEKEEYEACQIIKEVIEETKI